MAQKSKGKCYAQMRTHLEEKGSYDWVCRPAIGRVSSRFYTGGKPSDQAPKMTDHIRWGKMVLLGK